MDPTPRQAKAGKNQMRPQDTAQQRAFIARFMGLKESGKSWIRELQQEKKKLHAMYYGEGTTDAKREEARKLLLVAKRLLNAKDRSQEKRGPGVKVKAIHPKVVPHTGGTRVEIGGMKLTLPEGFKRPAGRPSAEAPFGRNGKGQPLAPWGLKGDGSVKLGPQGRKAAKAAKVAHKAAVKAAKVKAKSAGAPKGSIKTTDPLFPYGKKPDGTARSKPGRKPKATAPSAITGGEQPQQAPAPTPATPAAAPAPLAAPVAAAPAPVPATPTAPIEQKIEQPVEQKVEQGTLGALPPPVKPAA